ncbi:Co2+/Mg2+ efflux protein ApaG [Deinococcus taeanensis]|uniref:Co2+/Mg2+ efflux protein ApaG n=1 Tax=Deinococcus taeanensis TaxID=2737050 RepID=UPI001CDCFD4A|nr:Co2+/Mg2+ efflux protein ApaG [Deinococcus taeanensis]UBV41675.1 Co2+/Mg2+ efflux protein ApaG [Deinococcus taeanensis]
MPDSPPGHPPSPDVHVQVEIQHLAAHSTPERQLFTYVIRIENRSGDTWKLLARHWDIIDAHGQTTSVDGEGVVGEQPVLPPGGTFVYDSFVTLQTTPGRMSGHYVMQDAWGQTAHVPIPAFRLDVPGTRTLN